jgi:hypothetical protein
MARSPAPNLLDLAPTRAVEEERTPDGRIVLLRPKFGRGRLGRFLHPRLKRPYTRVHLDDIGSFVWARIDGRTTVGVIAEQAREHFGARIEPVHERLRLFLQQLEQGELIRMPRLR